MLKLKLISDPPPNAKFGWRPETHFIKISSSTHMALMSLMSEKNMTIEEAIKYVLQLAITEETKSNSMPHCILCEQDIPHSSCDDN